MRAARSLRGRVGLLATLAVAAVLLLVGATAVASFSEREHARVDDELAGRPAGALVRALGAPDDRGPVPPPPGFGQDLAPSQERVAALRNRLLLLGGLGVILVGGLSWWLSGLALQPLRPLRAAAGRVSTTRDLSTRLPAGDAPAEVEELSDGINAMLARLESSAAA